MNTFFVQTAPGGPESTRPNTITHPGLTPNILLPRSVMLKCHVAILEYFSRTQEHLVHADYWETMNSTLDAALLITWQDISDAGFSVRHFVRSFQSHLSLFHDVADINRILNASLDNPEPVLEELKRVMKESATGAAMLIVNAYRLPLTVSSNPQ